MLLVIAGSWLVRRKVEEYRVDAYVQRLRQLPGVVVTGVERGNGGWQISGLRDPLAADPADLLAQSNLDPARIVGHWEPYLALNPAIVLKRVAASLNPPPGVSLRLDGDTIRAQGSAPDHWLDKARALIAGLPAGSPPFDLSGLQDVQDPAFIRLRDAIQAHVVSFDTGAPRPASGQDADLDVLAAEFTRVEPRRERIGLFRARDDRRPYG